MTNIILTGFGGALGAMVKYLLSYKLLRFGLVISDYINSGFISLIFGLVFPWSFSLFTYQGTNENSLFIFLAGFWGMYIFIVKKNGDV